MKKNLLMLVLLSLVITTNAQQQGPPKPPMEQERNDGKGQRGGRFKDRGPKPEGKEKIEMFKIEFITKKLSLTTNEAELFWPVYNAHKKAMKEIIENKSNDEIQLQEAILNARKKYKNELKPVLKSEERVNEALKIEREFLQKVRHEMMRRKGFQS